MLNQETALNPRGCSIVGGESREGTGAAFDGVNPATSDGRATS
jgi:hypothetical protein